MTNTPRSRRLAQLAGGFGVALAAPMIGLFLTLPVPASGPASADCALGFIDNPATPGQCVPVPGEPREQSSPDAAPAPDNANGPDLSACDLSQPYQNTECPGAPPAVGTTTVDGPIDVTAPPPVNAPGGANGPDTSACELNQPENNPLCPGSPQL